MPYRTISSVWKLPIENLISKFEPHWNKLEKQIPNTGCKIFFRADDIGFCGKQFSLMIDVFKTNSTPLALAVVPSWMNKTRLEAIDKEINCGSQLWTIHQHGFRHINHETAGKKFEFGESRSKKVLNHEISHGRKKLENLFGSSFKPIFTPPWNRCSLLTMEVLIQNNFKAISRSKNVKPASLDLLPDIPVNVDLHTLKEPDNDKCLELIVSDINEAIQSGTMGIMLHHQRMNICSALFLDYLIKKILKNNKLKIVSIEDA